MELAEKKDNQRPSVIKQYLFRGVAQCKSYAISSFTGMFSSGRIPTKS